MLKTLDEKLNELSPERKKKVEARAAELIAEEMTLRDVRKALKLTQARVGELLEISQDNVSRIEKRSDMMISTLRSYIQAMGGELHITAKFPHKRPIEISSFAEAEE